MKQIWLTSLGSSQDPITSLMSTLKTYGLDVQGHFWKDDLKNMAWMAPIENLADPKIPFWTILASDNELRNPDIRYGLCLTALSIQAKKGIHFPIIILQTQSDLIDKDQLPTPLKGADILSASDPGLGAKLVAKAHTSPKPESSEYHMDIHGNEQIGQWFEVRPAKTSWPGIMFGVTDAEISFQAAGPAGCLPDKSVLNYPVQGLKLKLGETEYTAWATQNALNDETSYFVKVDGFPKSIIFGPYSEKEAADVYVLDLK
ncbi:MAG: hypothetical protein HF978_02215 [Desulfobacteraceae bacterium]|nr:hypothetical protein [Desulfobacteraceae bacterium]MBC2754339.1 hypothetical protein [Desulfobacteraceae bacterium]